MGTRAAYTRGNAGRGEPVLTLVSEPGPGEGSLYQRKVKPVIDVLLGSVLFVLSSPVLVLSMLLVRVLIGSPVIYRQERIGRNGQPFELYKLRTMIPDRRKSEQPYEGLERRQAHKSEDDPRVLPVGRLLRSIRLDELPQFWNVVRGDMSLVGPRPEILEIVESYENWQHERHSVKPGLTGPWQVSARNGKLMHECTEMDIEYIEHIRFSTDLRILAKTPVAMVRRRGF